jgi:hypothetical protein
MTPPRTCAAIKVNSTPVKPKRMVNGSSRATMNVVKLAAKSRVSGCTIQRGEISLPGTMAASPSDRTYNPATIAQAVT